MPFENVTRETCDDLAAMGREFADLYKEFARTAASVHPEVARKMKINGLGIIRNRMEQALQKTRLLKGRFENWKKESERLEQSIAAARQAAESAHAVRSKKRG